jgi:hypothetical protein
MNNLEKLVKSVKEMRELQRMYFKSKDWSDLTRAKSKEREVDALIVKIENPDIFENDTQGK